MSKKKHTAMGVQHITCVWMPGVNFSLNSYRVRVNGVRNANSCGAELSTYPEGKHTWSHESGRRVTQRGWIELCCVCRNYSAHMTKVRSHYGNWNKIWDVSEGLAGSDRNNSSF